MKKLFCRVILLAFCLALLTVCLSACGPDVTVTFQIDKENSFEREVRLANILEPPCDPARVGYKFVGWSREGTDWNFETITVEHTNITLVAKWEHPNTKHIYNDACDEWCNICDPDCNLCGEIKEVATEHIYDEPCGTTCNECGAGKKVPPHNFSEESSQCANCGELKAPEAE